MYINLVLGNQNGFRNLTTQIQDLTSDVSLYKDEILNKIEVRFIEFQKNFYSLCVFQDTEEQLLNHSLVVFPTLLESGIKLTS